MINRKQTLSKHVIRTTLLIAVLAGCDAREKTNNPLTTSYNVIKSQIGKKKRTNAVNASIRNITRANINAIPRPMVLRIEAIKNGSLGTAADIGENNGTFTITMADGKTIHLKNDILTGTRGQGNDLASLETSNETVIEGLMAGKTQRIYRHYDSEGQLQPLRMTCLFHAETTKTITLVDRKHTVIPVIENCKSEKREHIEQKIKNTYMMDVKTNQIWQSIQWISPVSGYFKIDVLKRP